MIRVFAVLPLPVFFKNQIANLIMGIYNLPLRGMSRMSGGKITWGQLMGLVLMFDGYFFKGLHKFNKEGRLARKERKAIKKAQKEEAAGKVQTQEVKETKPEPSVVEKPVAPKKEAIEKVEEKVPEQPIEVVEEPIVQEEVSEPVEEKEINEEIPSQEEVNETDEEFTE